MLGTYINLVYHYPVFCSVVVFLHLIIITTNNVFIESRGQFYANKILISYLKTGNMFKLKAEYTDNRVSKIISSESHYKH